MRRELELKLQEEFPFMQNKCPITPYMFEKMDEESGRLTHKEWLRAREEAEESGQVDFRNFNSYEQYGCDCNDGWYEVIRGLCRDIADAYAERGLEPDVVPEQIKEKFGTLRFYYSLSSTGESPLVLDFLGSGDSLTFSPNQSEMGKVVREIVNKWQKASAQTCEFCGVAGELRDLLWIRTLCEECYAPVKVKDDIAR
jgi:hypothetical protein